MVKHNDSTPEPYTMLVKTQSDERAMSSASMRALRRGYGCSLEIIERTDKGITVLVTPKAR